MSDHFDTVMDVVDKAINKYLSTGAESLNEHEMVLFSVWMLELAILFPLRLLHDYNFRFET